MRQQKVPQLESMPASVGELRQILLQVMSSPLVQRKPQECTQMLALLATLQEQLSNKVQLFRNGVITVSVAVVEKSGRTTLLKNLTGIEVLLTADERCTAFFCEILYANSPENEGLDIIYYTPEELLSVVQRQLTYLRKESNLRKDGKAHAWKSMPVTIEGFSSESYSLPPANCIIEEKVLLYEGALVTSCGTRTHTGESFVPVKERRASRGGKHAR